MSTSTLQTAAQRIQTCLNRQRDHLNLAGLGLTNAELEGIPEFKELTGLRYLDLTKNALTELPACVGSFTYLIWLGVNFNRLTKVDGVEKLVKLERLYLRGNAVVELPVMMGAVQALVEMDLTGNEIIRLPTSMGHLAKLEHVAVDDQALAPDQRAAWKQNGWQTLREHLLRGNIEALAEYRVSELYKQDLGNFGLAREAFEKVVREASSMFELREAVAKSEVEAVLFPSEANVSTYAAKIIVIGEREHGKTCLQRALRGESTRQGNPSTMGMNREKLHLDLDGGLISLEKRGERPGPQKDVIDCEVWDMGGQHDFRYMHQLLFSRQAIYLAVTMPRSGNSVQKLMEWLDLVDRRTASEATVIVVSTCGGVDQSLSLEDLRREFPKLKIHALHVVNTVEDAESKPPMPISGIDELRTLLAKIIKDPKEPYAQKWNRGWPEVFDELRQIQKPYVLWDTVQAICAKHGIEGTDFQEPLVRTGHFIGTWLWREDTPAGKGVVVLQPQWLNRAVARLVRNGGVVDLAHGLVDRSALAKLWQGKDDDGESFPVDTHDMLIQLLEINELAYRPKTRGQAHGQDDLLIITQMVQELPPGHLATVWPEVTPERFHEAQRIIAFVDTRGGLQLGEVKELVYLLIFRLRSLSLGHEGGKAVHWRRGLVVSYKDKSIARIELKDRELHVTLRYIRSDSLFELIDTQIGSDNDEMWNGLEKRVYLPCGKACRMPATNQLHGNGRIALSSCEENQSEGMTKVNCASQACGKPVKIDEVLPCFNRVADEVIEPSMAELIKQIAAGKTDWQKGVGLKLDGLHDVVALIQDEARTRADDLINTLSERLDSEPCLFSLKPVDKEWWRVSGWTEIEVDVTVWCEWTLMPVPFFGETNSRGPCGKVRLKMQRRWVNAAKKSLQFTKYALLTMKTFGVIEAAVAAKAVVGAVGASVAAGAASAGTDGAVEEAQKKMVDDALKTATEMEKAIKEDKDAGLRKTTEGADEGVEKEVDSLGMKGHGRPLDDKAAIQEIRRLFAEKDEEWGGLKPVIEESRWYWRHPQWEIFGRKK